MDTWFIILGLIFYFLFVIYAANQVDAGLWPDGNIRLMLYSLVAFLFVIGPFTLQAIFIASQPQNAELLDGFDPGLAVIVAVMAFASAVFGYNLVRADDVRAWVGRRVRGFKPESMVHQAAVLLLLVVVTLSMFQFVLGGGVSGTADAVEQSTTSPFITIFETSLWLLAAFLGVGYAIRRTMPQTLVRLGLRLPTDCDLMLGLGVGLILCGLSIAFVSIWQSLADPEAFAEQTRAAQGLSNQLTSLPMVLLVAGGAALGEEIFMRGALQPVFGIGLTSIFFSVLHSQYLLTPTFVFMLVVSVAFGLLRARISTTAAIVAHFVYNITPFLLVVLLGGTI